MNIRKTLRNTRWSLAAAALALVATLWLSFDDGDDFELAKHLDIYHTLMRELNIYYVDPVAPGDLVRRSIEQMLESLDPYTNYIPESKIETYRVMNTGQYGGIGASAEYHGEYPVVTEVYQDQPAHKAGLLVGDLLLEVDGVSVKDGDADQLGLLLKGQPSTTVRLRVRRPGQESPLALEVGREIIKMPNVPHHAMVAPKVGYIKLSGFTEQAGLEVKEALQDLKGQGAEALVLDLRGNPGGLLIEAVNIVNLFVPQGVEVVRTLGKVSQWNNVFQTRMPPIDTQMPVAVIVNSNSASASEIVSGALQDLDRAVIVGQRSFGKGLVQITRPLSYNAQLKITVAKYYIPSGRCIQAIDYTHRRPDGSVGHVPDSLVSEFRTRAGRPVFDGGGVMPDVQVPERPLSPLGRALVAERLVFDFATRLAQGMARPESPEAIALDDRQFAQFVAFVKESGFAYQTQREAKLLELEQAAREELAFERASAQFEALRQSLRADLDADLALNRAPIEGLLRRDLAARFFQEEGLAKASLDDDPDLDAALEILADPARYAGILRP